MNQKTLLAISVCLNLGLVAGYFFTPQREVVDPGAESGSKPAAVKASSSGPDFSRPVQAFDWTMVESSDYRQYIENLRSIGCPEETIKDIILADINKLFENRRRELVPAENYEFWKPGQELFGAQNSTNLQEQVRIRRELAKEKRALVKDLLGVDLPERGDEVLPSTDPKERMLAFLPAGKRTELMALEQKYAAMRSSFQAIPGDFSGTKKMQEEKEAELARILTPQEMEEYQLRMSATANNLRLQLAGFQPTEQEFRELFRIKKQFDDQYGGPAAVVNDPELQQERAAAQKDLEVQIQQVLGGERFEEYQRSQDWGYKSALETVKQQGLPEDTAQKVYELKKIAEEQARQFRTDQSLTLEQQFEAMAAIRAEAERGVEEILGAKGYEFYQKQAGSMWLKSLYPGLQAAQ